VLRIIGVDLGKMFVFLKDQDDIDPIGAHLDHMDLSSVLMSLYQYHRERCLFERISLYSR